MNNTTKKPLNHNRMKAKEKAKELVQRFIAHAYHNNNELQCKDHSKQCALMAVDEIINQCWDYREIDLEASYNYWEEVKQEIINL